MSMQMYSTAPSRNLIYAEATMLKYAEGEQCICLHGDHKEHPKNKTDTIVFRRLQPYNAGANGVAQINPADFMVQEGVTPNASTISYTDVSVTLKKYAVLFSLTSKAELMHEDDIPKDMQELTGKTMGEIRELIAYNEAKSGPAVIYSNGSSRAAVNQKISIERVHLMTEYLENNLAKKGNKEVMPGPDFNTSAVEESWVVYCHSDLAHDIRSLSGFTKRVEYGSAIKPIHKREFGAVDDVRFVTSPLFRPFLGAGSGTLNGMKSVGGSAVDVYPVVMCGANSMGHVSLKGHGMTGISPTYLPATQKSHFNPAGQFGWVGGDFWGASIRLNDNWMVRGEFGKTNLAA